jgi:hypothetical protein
LVIWPTVEGVAHSDEYQAELYVASKPTPITLHRWHDALKISRPAYVNLGRRRNPKPIVFGGDLNEE